MKKCFNVSFEFNRKVFNKTIKNAICARVKGYVCVIDGNVLAYTYKNSYYKDIINGALVNSCDGSSIAMLASMLHGQRFKTYTGPEIFSAFISKGYTQLFFGNTEDVLNKLYSCFEEKGLNTKLMSFSTLPFLNVNDFDYALIAQKINSLKPDIIWVSLGAPKQEYFISKIFPFINQGVLIAIGAAFNFYLDNDNYSRAPLWLRIIHLEWLYRIIKEPVRVGKRALDYAVLLPRLIVEERKKIKSLL